MEAINQKLKQLNEKIVQVKIRDLTINKFYKILDAEKKYSTYFKKHCINLIIADKRKEEKEEYFKILLPSRYNILTEEDLSHLIGKFLIYRGIKTEQTENSEYIYHLIDFTDYELVSLA